MRTPTISAYRRAGFARAELVDQRLALLEARLVFPIGGRIGDDPHISTWCQLNGLTVR
jgi:hypothetical protein